MKYNTIRMEHSGANLAVYFQEASPELKNSIARPCVLVIPGGGYAMRSDREAEPIALAFAARGFQTAVLQYPVAPSRFPESLFCLAEAVAWLRANAGENNINPSQITTCGFSAGGHLAASLGVFWSSGFLSEKLGIDSKLIQPNRQILCYPVITSGKYAHVSTFDNLLGADASEEEREKVSLEKFVNAFVPPSFIWHTFEDQIVPVENSLMFADELRKHNVPFELHIYSEGVHGLSLSSDVTMDGDGGSVFPDNENWLDMACRWLKRPVKAYIKRK